MNFAKLLPADVLLAWYDRHQRALPWRLTPEAHAAGDRADPYRVWLSEIMLQQTTVKAVKPYFERFVTLWPTVESLAAAGEEPVLREWAGLGYYSRARNLIACARRVATDLGGRFPQTSLELQDLPGIGPYTAAAIAAIAFNERAAVVDGNIERVFSRYFAISAPLPQAKADIREHVLAATPSLRPGDFAQALMDLGATLCTPRSPACALCPLEEGCVARRGGNPTAFPVKAPRKVKPVRRGAAFIAERAGDGAVLLVKRPVKGLLGGMSGVPTTHWTARQDGETGISAAPLAGEWQRAGTIGHVFTHFELRLDVFHAVICSQTAASATLDGWWSAPRHLPEEALPSVMKKAISAALPQAFAPAPQRGNLA
ncbi:A/G-specific adenine glycosylase [Pseudohoeflea coraliihabitans]|uniref:Adenine DNA glycosylase n=1 Tax=Pseudohoeflea coraliihabitans TaxID=2860393 RepID=A0ABS6WLW1_9HYPH|nr:A/G-specific adenine glycosylase [Pseudohoeflea sp. DP4N28-3]MBW3096916.1 A/G-specific adenine glycosylase [Pseudohoeflea sp. DP4N28-3]